MSGALDTAYPEPQASTGLMLWRVTNSWQRTIRAALAPFDLPLVQFVLLAVLTWMDRSAPVTQRNLAASAATDPTMTSQVLRALEGKGLIERLAHRTDGRARTLAPTPAGVNLVNRANAAVEHADRAYFAALGDDAHSFTCSLATLDAGNVEPMRGGPRDGRSVAMPLVAHTRCSRLPVDQVAYDCLTVLLMRDGRAIVESEELQQPISVGDFVLIDPSTLAAHQPEREATVSTLLIDTTI